jgi:hypothetical protein
MMCCVLFMDIFAQDTRLNGTWSITDLSYITNQGVQKVMESEIKAGTAITDMFFMEENKFRQTSNMSGSGTTDTYDGTWKISDNKLILNLKIEGQLSPDIEYVYKIEGNTLSLERSNPMGTMKFSMTFKRK